MYAISRSRIRSFTVLMVLLACGGQDVQERGLEEVTLEPVFRVGELDGDAALTEILATVVGPDGLLYITQWQDAHVTAFGPDGSVARRIGRAGSGPGEFTQAGLLGFLGDGLWVSGRNRLSVFGPDGTVVRHLAFRHGLGDPRLTYGPSRYMEGGTLVATVSIRSSMIARGEISRVPILLTSPDGTILDTLATTRVPRTTAEIQLDDHSLYGRIDELGGPGHAFAVDGSTLVLLDVSEVPPDNGILTATWVSPKGDTLAVQADTFPLRQFSSELRSQIVDQLAAQWSEFLPLTEARLREAADEQVPWPEFEPPYTSAVVGSDQRLWLRREVGPDGATWEVWTPDRGASLRVSAPADLELTHAADDYIWGVRKNSLDVPFLYRYQIVPLR